MKRKNPERCPFCQRVLNLHPGRLTKAGPATYAYQPCGCLVQFDAGGYPHRPRPLTGGRGVTG